MIGWNFTLSPSTLTTLFWGSDDSRQSKSISVVSTKKAQPFALPTTETGELSPLARLFETHEVALEVFKRCGIQGVLQAGRVCKKWNKLSQDKQLRKALRENDLCWQEYFCQTFGEHVSVEDPRFARLESWQARYQWMKATFINKCLLSSDLAAVEAIGLNATTLLATWLQNGTVLPERVVNGQPLLFIAATNGSREMHNLFADHMPESWKRRPFELKDAWGSNLAHSLAAGNQTEILARAAEGGVNLWPRDSYKATPMHHAAVTGQNGTVRLFLDLGRSRAESEDAWKLPRDWLGFSPLDWAKATHQTAVVQLLEKEGFSSSPCSIRAIMPPGSEVSRCFSRFGVPSSVFDRRKYDEHKAWLEKEDRKWLEASRLKPSPLKPVNR